MRSRNTQPIFILLTGFIIFIFGIVGADAQGNGHGNKHGGGENHGNRGGEDRGGGKHREGNDGWQGRGNGNGNGNGRWQREDRNEGRQDRGNGNGRWQREERRDDRGQRDAWRQEQRRQDDRRVNQDRERWQQHVERNYGEARRQRRDDRRDDRRENRGWQQQQQQWNPWGNIWPQSYRNYGQWRSEQVHQRNAERKAWKNERKAMRYYEQAYPRYSYQNRNYSYYNDSDRNYYGSQSQDRAGVLRSLIANVLGSNNYLSGAQPLYYGEQYYQPRYQTSSRSYASAPYYNYQPSYAYAPQYNNDNYSPYYKNSNSGILGGLPFGNFTDLIGGDGFVGQMLGNLLAVGYEQGYFQGLDALQAGSGNRYYSDPYTYSGTNYLSSSSLGDNRSYLSNGYQLGYNDALNNRGASVLDQDTNVDLVSLLLGNALQVL